MKHTKEPWQGITENDNGLYLIIDYTGDEIGNYDGEYSFEDAKRIVTCINACTGITNEKLESGYIQKLIAEREEAINLLKAMNEHLNKILGEYKNEAI